jgi:hypothetical protein
VAFSHVAGFWFGLSSIPAAGYEGDVAPRGTGGNGRLNVGDLAQIGRFIAGIDTPVPGREFAKADCAPRSTRGNGLLTVADYTQTGRYVAGLDPPTPMGGPFGPAGGPFGPVAPSMPDEPETPPAGLVGETGAARSTASDSPAARLLQIRFDEIPNGIGQVDVIVELDARGGENALGFSIRFDAARLKNPRLALGADMAAASLFVNEHGATDGRIGVVLALPPGASLNQGPRQIARIRFNAAASGPNYSIVKFSNAPVICEIASVEAEALKTYYKGPRPETALANSDRRRLPRRG